MARESSQAEYYNSNNKTLQCRDMVNDEVVLVGTVALSATQGL